MDIHTYIQTYTHAYYSNFLHDRESSPSANMPPDVKRMSLQNYPVESVPGAPLVGIATQLGSLLRYLIITTLLIYAQTKSPDPPSMMISLYK